MSDLVRQSMFDALKRARQECFDWLLVVDADEFAFADNHVSELSEYPLSANGNLVTMLTELPPEIEMVSMRTKEVVPFYCDGDQPFWRQVYFQDEHPLTRTIVNPLTGESREWKQFIGHQLGKSIVRTSANVQPFSPHNWVVAQDKRYPMSPAYLPVPSESRGFHYHFAVTDPQHFKDKYRKLSKAPSVWNCGFPVDYPKQTWKESSVAMSDAELDAYVKEHFYLPQSVLEAHAEDNRISKDNTVEAVLRESGYFERLSEPVGAVSRLGRWLSGLFSRETVRFPFNDVDLESLLKAKTEAYLDASQWPDGRYCGFYGVETYQDKYFRWSTDQSEISLDVPPQAYRLGIDLGPLYDPGRKQDISLRFNDVQISQEEIGVEDGRLTVDLAKRLCRRNRQQKLSFSCPPLDTSSWSFKDPRTLGIPVFGIALSCV